jgi:hypothetical protein
VLEQPTAGQGRLPMAPLLQRTLVVSHPAGPIGLGVAHNHKPTKMVLTHA